MVNAERIKEINKNLPTVPIKGKGGKVKNYVMVKDRVAAFRELFPEWTIQNDRISDDGVTVTVRTTVANEEGRIIATAHAQERYNSTPVNSTSALENCETSAIGRALALLGIGIDDSFASANETETAQARQEAGDKWPAPGDKIKGNDVAKLRALLGSDERVAAVLAYYHLDSLAAMTYEQFRDCVQKASGGRA